MGMLFGVASFANMVGRFSAWFTDIRGLKKLSRGRLERMFEDKIIRKCVKEVHNGENKLSRGEYIMFMPKELQLVDPLIIKQLDENFERIDVDGNGFLDEHDIKDGLSNSDSDSIIESGTRMFESQ